MEGISAQIKTVRDYYNSLAISRTPFMLRNFVLGIHGDLCPKTVFQLLLEAKVLSEELVRLQIESEEIKRSIRLWTEEKDIQKVFDSQGNPKFIYPDLERVKLESKLCGLESDYLVKKREFDFLYKVLQELPTYKIEDMLEDEPRYWTQRYLHQLTEAWQAARTGFDRGDLMSLRQANSKGFLDEMGGLAPIEMPSDMLVNLLVAIVPPQYNKQLQSLVDTILLESGN